MNELTNSTREKINLLEAKFDRLEMAFERCLDVSLNNETGLSVVPLKNKVITISLLSEIESIEDYEIALETLNQAGNVRGVEFKKGVQKQNKGELPFEKSIICKFTDRNKEKHSTAQKSVSTTEAISSERPLVKDVNCPVVYKFALTNGKISLKKAVEDHNHSPFLNTQKKLTPMMVADIEGFSKNSTVTEIKDFLENKYTVKLDYMTVYHQFRALYPKFGVEGCQNFLNYLTKQEALF